MTVVGWIGAESEGTFEISTIAVSQHDPAGIRQVDSYDLTQLDEAWARYAELRPDPPFAGLHPPQGSGGRVRGTGPLRIPPNAAARTGERADAAMLARDLDTFARLCAPTMLMEDRRRGVLLRGGRDMFLESNRITAGSRVVPTLLATAGDRLTLSHLRWSDPAGKKWEVEALNIHEVDAEGRTVAVIAFDPDDRRAAAMEMLERFARSEEARSILPVSFEGLRAVNAHDVDRVRAVLADDFVMDDHRRTGLGRLDRETYLASLAALFDEAPDMMTEILYVVAVEKHGLLDLARNFGTLREGGAFESVYLRIWIYEGDLTSRVEMFEPKDLEVARARFEELGAGTV